MRMAVARDRTKVRQERFLARANRAALGCWIWTGRKNSQGYGRCNSGDFGTYAHRVAFQLFCGPIPKGMQVLHKCDVPSCVRPDHLFVGTQKQNVADMIAKGRRTKLVRVGEAIGMHKLKAADIPVIRKRIASGERQKDIAADYRVIQQTISAVARGFTWGHIR